MSEMSAEVRDAQFAFVSAYVRELDPTASDAAITRYLSEIETMAAALRSLDAAGSAHAIPFNAEWPDGADE